MLRRIIVTKIEEITGGWRQLHSDELHNFCSSPNINRVMKSRRLSWVGHVTHLGELNAYKILVGKPEGMRPHGKPGCRWEDKADVKEIVYEGVDWV
jgi:hypothetical protein